MQTIQKALDPVETARSGLGDAVKDVITFRGELTIVVDPGRIVDICTFFRDTSGLECNFLSAVTSVDYSPEEPRFALGVHPDSLMSNRRPVSEIYLSEAPPQGGSSTA